MQRAIVIAALALLFVGCVGKARKSNTIELVSDKLQVVCLTDSLTTDTLDMGRVSTGEVVSRHIALKNGSEGKLIITSTDTSCGCLELAYPTEPIAAGAKVAAEMTFYSAGYNYFVPRTFTIYSSTGVAKRLIVTAQME